MNPENTMSRVTGALALSALCILSCVYVHAGAPNPAIATMIDELGLTEHPTPSRELPGWHVPTKVVIQTSNEEQTEAFAEAMPGIHVVGVQTLEDAMLEIKDADVLLGYCSEALLKEASQLRWLQVYSAGVEQCVASPRVRSGQILMTNGQSIGSPALAEHAVGMMFMLMRGMDLYYSNQLKGQWQSGVGNSENTFLELTGRTVLVVGLGGIGTQVAKRAHALGMRVIATRGSRREGPDYVEYVGLADEALTLATRADVVINTVPLTERTRGMFNADFFSRMKKTAYYISVGRGGTTVTEDLVTALEQGTIAGAGLDVTDPEPLPAGHPLWSAPRVIITPHNAGRSDRSLERLWLLLEENLRRYVAGDALLSVVDPVRGY
jgi:phosphoglycerate dehydrogenase-like enzyme